MKTFFKNSILFVLLFGCRIIFAQTFTASISPSSIGKDETAELKLMIEAAQQVQQINPPALDNFIVVGGPNQETSIESVNGVTKQSIGITYILKPKSTGSFSIGAATATADGKTLKSNTVKLKVTNAPSGNGQNNLNNPMTSLLGNMPAITAFDKPQEKINNY